MPRRECHALLISPQSPAARSAKLSRFEVESIGNGFRACRRHPDRDANRPESSCEIAPKMTIRWI
ncbi:MAG: hypothetical protein ABS79_01380 [Planctomycetes bacterium SCN 63-9]|nr:MAG: hypothetical protein ABS79_01380 [Planctomycetes bacterium SCN 63-9]